MAQFGPGKVSTSVQHDHEVPTEDASVAEGGGLVTGLSIGFCRFQRIGSRPSEDNQDVEEERGDGAFVMGGGAETQGGLAGALGPMAAGNIGECATRSDCGARSCCGSRENRLQLMLYN